jgi:hypothetical protein
MSRLERDVECGGSLVFPRSPRESQAAGYGNLVHDFLMRVPRLGRELALEQVPDPHRDALEDLELEGLPLDGNAYAQEVALAFNVETGEARELCRGQGRPDYAALGAGPNDAVGTLDVLGLTETHVVVIDYKTGFADLGPVRNNWQLRGCALLAARAYKRERAIIAIIRVREGGEDHFVDRAELGPMDLDIVEDALRGVRERKARFGAMFAAGEAVPTKQNPRWCKYCPSFDACPAKVGLLALELAFVHAQSEPRPPQAHAAPVLTDEAFPKYLLETELLEQAVARRRAILDEAATAHPRDLGDGYMYGQKMHAQESIDVVAGEGLLVQWLGAELENVVETRRTLAKEAARKAISKRFRGKKDPVTGARLKLGDVFDTFCESLREAQAMKIRVTYPVTKFKRGKNDGSGSGGNDGRGGSDERAETAGQAAEGGEGVGAEERKAG